MLEQGLRLTYGSGQREPELVNLKKDGPRQQAVAVFRMDCEGVELEPEKRDSPNKAGVHEVRWLDRTHPDLRDRHHTRWPLLRVICALCPRQAQADAASAGSSSEEEDGEEGSRSRSRSPRRGQSDAAPSVH